MRTVRTDRDPDPDFELLRDLVVGEERNEIEDLEGRLDELEANLLKRVSKGLPEAFRHHVESGEKAEIEFGEALRGTVEQAVRASVAKDKSKLSDSLFPIMGPAIRSYVTDLFKGMVENLNEVIRNTTSVSRLRWRAEAKLAGKPFSEYVLLKTARYRVEEVFLMERDTGLLMMHLSRGDAERDADLVSGMFSAIRSFVQDSFSRAAGSGDGEERLDGFEFGDREVVIEDGPSAILAVSVEGTPPADFRGHLAKILEDLHSKHRDALEDFGGDRQALATAQPILQRAMVERQPAESKTTLWPAWLVLGTLAAALIAFFTWKWHKASRITGLVEAVEAIPGIDSVSAEKHRGRLRLSGLRDPAAADPWLVAAERGFADDELEFALAPFHSAEPQFVDQRAAQAERQHQAELARRLATERRAAEAQMQEKVGGLQAEVGRLSARERQLARALLETGIGNEPGVSLEYLADGSVKVSGMAAEPRYSEIKAMLGLYGGVFTSIDHDELGNASEEALDRSIAGLRAAQIRFVSGAATPADDARASARSAAALIETIYRQAAILGLEPRIELRARPLVGDNAEYLVETAQRRLANARALLLELGVPAAAIAGASIDPASEAVDEDFGLVYFHANLQRD